MRTNASFASSGRSPYAPGLPLLSCEITASSQAVHSVAARDRTPMSGASIICEYARSRPEIGGVVSVGSRYEPARPAKSRNRAQASGKNRPAPRYSQSSSSRLVEVTLSMSIPLTRSGCRSAYASDSVTPPRPAAQQPLLHVKVLAQLLHVPEQVPGRVQAHVSRGVAGVRQAAAAVALVEDDDPELLRVEGPPVSRRAPRPRSAVHDQRWHAIRVPAGLPVHEVPVTRVQQTALIRLDIRIPRHTKKAIGPAPHLDQAPGLRHRFPHNPWRGGSGLVGAGAAPNIPVRPHTEAVDGQGAGRLACRYVGHMAGSPSTGPVVRAVITMLCTWGCGRPCGPWWCSKEAATQRWGLTGENLLRPASCRNLSAA